MKCAAKNDLDAFRGCLMGGAIGDALGYTVEFMRTGKIHSRFGTDGIQEYERKDGRALLSDDTQMTLFTATGLLSGKARMLASGIPEEPWVYPGLAYKTWYQMQIGGRSRNKNGEGYSWLADVPELGEWRAPGTTCTDAIEGETYGTVDAPLNDSKGCGGIMRVAPVGLYFNRKPGEDRILDVEKAAAGVAALTHGHELGWMSAAVLAHIINRLVYAKMSISEAAEDAMRQMESAYAGRKHLDELAFTVKRAMELAGNAASDAENLAVLGEGWVAEETLAVALYCSLKYQDDFSKAVRVAVNHDGDSDSTGAVTGNILGAVWGYERIPEFWKQDLECADVILEVADDLYADCPSADDLSAGQAAITPEWKRKYIENKRWGRYAFYGSEASYGVYASGSNVPGSDVSGCYVSGRHRKYRGIATPVDLYRALSGIWCRETCAPRMRTDWTPENKTLGQCSITAFLAQDIFGGVVRGLTTENGNIHCYNVVDGIVFDLTSEQFGAKAKELDYNAADPVQERESAYHFGKQEKLERYEYLKAALWSAGA